MSNVTSTTMDDSTIRSLIRSRCDYIVQKLLPHVYSNKPYVIQNHKFQTIASVIDHTVLKPQATSTDITNLCNEALYHNFVAVCVNPSRCFQAVRFLKNSNVDVACVIGFPLGSNSYDIKQKETEQMINLGVKEIDMVINIGYLIEGNYKTALKDIEVVVSAAGQKGIVKVILETCLLTKSQIIDGCILSVLAATGFSTGGATVEDVRIMRLCVGDATLVKASGGIKNLKQCIDLINAGASRIGTSAGVFIMREEKEKRKLNSKL